MPGKQKQRARGTSSKPLKGGKGNSKEDRKANQTSRKSARLSHQGSARKGRRAPANAAAPTPAPTAATAGNTLAGIEKLHAKTDALHQKAHELHKSAEAAHITAQNLHEQLDHNFDDTTIGSVTGDDRDHHAEVDGEAESRNYGKPFPIVGIGASAGGFEALNQFLAALPRDTGMAFVIVQHLDPSHESQLTELLRRGAHLSVQEIRNNTDVESNRIYVMPPNTSLKISGGKLRLSKRQRAEIPQMPVDRFFRSLAEDQLDLAIGVVLSGSGSDG